MLIDLIGTADECFVERDFSTRILIEKETHMRPSTLFYLGSLGRTFGHVSKFIKVIK